MPNLTEVAKPLTALTKKVAPTMVLWTPGCQQSFLKLRSLLTPSSILRAPDYSLPLIVQTDASDIGRATTGAASLNEDLEMQ